ncbi:hypothetical protein RI129_006794 [Pyrocoelia pectoralis]|uniref:Uncharacterized protein n=1 Tax=Pyrocoelia pectoralis TaxID=417401 RepID=A0AAN7VKA2_9COLE
MTRKTCLDHLHVGITLKSVCHELLHDNPWSLSLPKVYKTLDTLLNKNGMKLNYTQMTRNKMPRTRARSMCCKLKQSPLSLTNYTHRLRTRRHTAYVNNYLDTSGDDDSNHVAPMRELRSSSRISQMKVESDLDVWESGRPKRTCIVKKRGSADERLMFDNRNYYKVEVLSNKLRSVRERKIKSPIISEDSEDAKVYSFPKKKKQSEITRLNNEAENFLFPHKGDSSSDETDATDPPPPQSTRKRETNENVKPKIIKTDTEDGSMDSNSSESSVVKKKRRLTQAEAFILDNQRYYKFETPGSRLRYQGSYLSPLTTKNNGEYGIKHSRIKESESKPSLKLEDLKFAFEMVPNTEPWYDTFQRQDKGQECYTCYNYFAGYKPFLLPYEMGPLPSLNPRVCFYAYKQMKKEILGDTGPSASEACSTPDADIFKTDYNSSTGEDTKSSEDVRVELVPQKVFRKSKRRKVLSGKNPRKSPRQHASTLAILSSLIHQRKRREYKCRVSHQSKNLSVIVEEKEEPEPDYDVLSKSIDDMLSNSYSDLNLMDRLVGDDAIDVHCKSNAIECLDDYIRGENGDVRKAKDNPRNVTRRKPARKKKKNRTGWPNKNKRQTFRKEGSDSRDGVESIKNSRIDSGTEESSSDNNLNKSKNKSNLSNKLLNINKLNGDVQVSKFNGELYFKNVGVPKRKEHRESSSDNCVEVVIPSVGDKIDCVNVDLAKWENAEKLLAAKIRCEDINNDILFQPIVRVQKLDSNIEEKCIEKQFSVSTSKQNRRPRRMPASPKSPRMLRRPRGRWY